MESTRVGKEEGWQKGRRGQGNGSLEVQGHMYGSVCESWRGIEGCGQSVMSELTISEVVRVHMTRYMVWSWAGVIDMKWWRLLEVRKKMES